MDQQDLAARLLELRFEIQELEREGREYLSCRNPTPYQRHMQDVRIERLEEIKGEIVRLAAQRIQ